MNWCALPHDMTYMGNPSQGPPPQQQTSVQQQQQQPMPQPQLPPSATLPPAKKPKAKASKESKPPMPPKPPKEPGAKRQRSKAAPGGSGGKKGKAEVGDELGVAEALGGRPATPDPDLADAELAGARETANPALDSEVVVIHAGSRLLRVGLAGLHAPPPLLLPHCVAYRRAAAVRTSAAACGASAAETEAEAAEDDAAEASLGPLTRQLRAASAWS